MSVRITKKSRITLGMIVCLGLVCGLAFALASRGESLPSAQVPAATSGISMIRSLIALAIVLGGLLGVNWYLKNRSLPSMGGKTARRMKMIEKFPIDQKRSLLLMSLDGQEILLGIGGDQIQHLVSLPVEAARSPRASS